MRKAPAHRRRRLEQRRSRHLCRPHAGLGRDDRRAALRDEPWRQGRQPGGRRGEARRRRSSWCRRSATTCWARACSRISRRSASTTRHVQRVAGQSTGTATILVNKSGDNFILIVKGANGDLTPADVERAGDDLKACDLILLQLEVPLETVYAALAFGKRHGVRTVLNPAPGGSRPRHGQASRDASFLMPNETELAILTGMPVESEDEIAAAARSLVAAGLRDGDRDARRPRRAHRDARGRAADRAGQGRGDRHDRRRRRLHRQLRPLLRRRPFDLDAALAEATRYAAISVTRRGAQKSFATEAEFEAFCARLG